MARTNHAVVIRLSVVVMCVAVVAVALVVVSGVVWLGWRNLFDALIEMLILCVPFMVMDCVRVDCVQAN